MVSCCWKIAGLLDVNNDDEKRIAEILDIDREIFESENFAENMNETIDEDETEEDEQQEEYDDIEEYDENDQNQKSGLSQDIVRMDIDDIQLEDKAKSFKQSQITNFFQKK